MADQIDVHKVTVYRDSDLCTMNRLNPAKNPH
jgi:hypothetical protein